MTLWWQSHDFLLKTWECSYNEAAIRAQCVSLCLARLEDKGKKGLLGSCLTLAPQNGSGWITMPPLCYCGDGVGGRLGCQPAPTSRVFSEAEAELPGSSPGNQF